jgi:hypothetical protein
MIGVSDSVIGQIMENLGIEEGLTLIETIEDQMIKNKMMIMKKIINKTIDQGEDTIMKGFEEDS